MKRKNYAIGGPIRKPEAPPVEEPLNPAAEQQFGPEGVAARREEAAKAFYAAVRSLLPSSDQSPMSQMGNVMSMVMPLTVPGMVQTKLPFGVESNRAPSLIQKVQGQGLKLGYPKGSSFVTKKESAIMQPGIRPEQFPFEHLPYPWKERFQPAQLNLPLEEGPAPEIPIKGINNFRRFIKNSVVVDEKGTPVALSHGTIAAVPFDEFYTATGRDIGAHFGSEQAAIDRLKSYGVHPSSFLNDPLGPYHQLNDPGNRPRIYKAFLSIKKPIDLPDLGGWDSFFTLQELRKPEYKFDPKELEHLTDQVKSVRYFDPKLANQKVVQFLESHGYDGVRYRNDVEDKGAWSYIAFHPEQVKSVHNLGEWSKHPSIFRSLVPATAGAEAAREALPQRDEPAQNYALGGEVNYPNGGLVESPTGPPLSGSLAYLLGPSGAVIPVDAAAAPELLGSGRFGIPSPEQIKHFQLQEKYGGFTQQVMTGVEGLLSGVTLGGSRVAERALGVPGMAERAEANPATRFGSEMVGTALPFIFTEGAGPAAAAAKITGPALAARAGKGAARAVTELLPETAIAGRALARGLVGGGVEGTVFGLGQTVDESALGDSQLTAQKLFTHAGLGALVGGGLGTALGATEAASPFLLGKAKSALDGAYGRAKSFLMKSHGEGENAATVFLEDAQGAHELQHVVSPQTFERLSQGDAATARVILENQSNFAEMAKSIPGFADAAADAAPTTMEWALGRMEPLIAAEQIRPGITVKLLQTEPSLAEEILSNVDKIYLKGTAGEHARAQVTRDVYKKAQNVVTATDRALTQLHSDIAPRLRESLASLGPEEVQKFFQNPAWQDWTQTFEAMLPRIAENTGEFSKGILPELTYVEKQLSDLLQRATPGAPGPWFKEWYEQLLEVRSNLGKLVKWNEGYPVQPIVKRTQGLVKDLYSKLSNILKDPNILGDQAGALATIDQAHSEWLSLFEKGRGGVRTFGDLLGQRSAGRAVDPKKVERLVRSITTDKSIDQAEAYAQMLDTARRVHDTIESISERLPTGRYDASAAQDLIERAAAAESAARRNQYFTDALNLLPAARASIPPVPPPANPVGDLLSGILLSQASRLAPGASSLLSAVALAGKAAKALKSVGNQVALLSAIERVTQGVTKRLDNYSTMLVRGWQRGTQIGRAEAAAGVSKEFSKSPERATLSAVRRMELVQRLGQDPTTMYEVLGRQQDILGRHAPETALALNAATSAAITYLSAHTPPPPDRGLLSGEWKPNAAEVAAFNRRWEAVNDPLIIVRQAAAGTLTPEAIEAVQAVHPHLFDAIRASVMTSLMQYGKLPEYKQRLMISMLLGQDVDGSLKPQSVAGLQATYGAPTARGPELQARPPIEALMMARPSKKGMMQIRQHERLMTPSQSMESRAQKKF